MNYDLSLLFFLTEGTPVTDATYCLVELGLAKNSHSRIFIPHGFRPLMQETFLRFYYFYKKRVFNVFLFFERFLFDNDQTF